MNTTISSNLNTTSFVQFDSVSFDSVSFDSVSFDSVSFDSVSFDSVSFDSVSFDSVSFDSVSSISVSYDSVSDSLRSNSFSSNLINLFKFSSDSRRITNFWKFYKRIRWKSNLFFHSFQEFRFFHYYSESNLFLKERAVTRSSISDRIWSELERTEKNREDLFFSET
jgi:hypothetical protein